ncbi:hypothetical protein [[Erwinia] mediterraneensis]|uniref:hypothetical protein n=1 Tax=[Erwinia] mediterraneensis TaxID=2161819 RepID=UPI00103046F2|nr:hypothetical protein [[Erwinia] mediterraneensis]
MAENNRDLMPYRLFYCDDRLLVQNIDGHLIDIGGATQQQGRYHWQLDGNDEQGEQSASVQAMLQEVEQHLSFLFLDGQFTSLPDLSEQFADRLEDVPSREIRLHELSDDDEQEIR